MVLASFLVCRPRDLVAVLTCVVFAFVSVAGVRAQDASGVPSASVTAPGAAASGASVERAAAATKEATPAPDSSEAELAPPDSVEVPAPTVANAGGRAELERRLHELEYERAHWTNFWPWLVVGTGIGVTALGTVVGVGAAFSCEQGTTCAAPPWATLFVVVGVAIGAAGSLWLVRTDAGIRELEIQTQRVRTDLEQLNHARLSRERGFAPLGSAPLNLHLTF